MTATLERLGTVVSRVLTLHAARNTWLEAEARLRAMHGFCEGCDCPLSRCGPELWKEQRTCCPDCTHGATHE